MSCAPYTAAVYTARRPCTRPINTSSPAKTARTRPYNGRAVYTARTRPCMDRVYGTAVIRLHHPCTCLYGRLRPCTWRVHGPVHGTCTRPCTGRAHDTYTAAYTCLRVHVYKALYGPSTRLKTAVYTAVHCDVTYRVYGSVRDVCTAVFGRVHWPCTLPFLAVYIARTRPLTALYSAVRRPCTRVVWAVYTAGTRPIHSCVHVRLHGPCTRSQTARYGRVRPVTALYTARSQPVHGSVYGRVRRPLHGRPTRAYVYTAVKRPCTRHVHVRVHGQYTVVCMAGRPTRPCARAETARCGRGPCTRP